MECGAEAGGEGEGQCSGGEAGDKREAQAGGEAGECCEGVPGGEAGVRGAEGRHDAESRAGRLPEAGEDRQDDAPQRHCQHQRSERAAGVAGAHLV